MDINYLIILASGLADEAMEALGGRTPLDAAQTPALDELARLGKIGSVRMIPDDLPASEEVALLSALGYSPHRYFSGEGGLVAEDAGFRVGQEQSVACFNLVTAADGRMVDHTAGRITPKEAQALLASLTAALGRPDVSLYAGCGFTGAALLPIPWSRELHCAPPDAVLGRPFNKHLPSGPGSDLLRRLIEVSQDVFREHEINRVRTDLGENPASVLWPWGPGAPPALPGFDTIHKIGGAMLAGPGAARGLGRLARLHTPSIESATAQATSIYEAQAKVALTLIRNYDLVALHLDGPADAALEGDAPGKIAAIESIDALVVAPLLRFARENGRTRVLFLPTHVADTARRCRTHGEVPVALFGPGLEPLRQGRFTEHTARSGEIEVMQGDKLLPYFLRP